MDGRARQWWDLRMAMRDGVALSADVYFPDGGAAAGPYPTVLGRTPYDNQVPPYVAMARHLTAHGYAVVLQDVRGRHDSEGEWVPFRDEGPDGYDTVEWIAAQPWSTGKVGTFGGSYGGWYQWALARERPPHLTTMVSTASCAAWFEELPYDRGILMLVMLGWLNLVGGRSMQRPELIQDWPDVFRHLPLSTMDQRLGRDLPVWREWLSHPTLDAYWRQVRMDDHFAGIDLPVLHITGLYDGDQPGALFLYRGMMDRSPAKERQRIVIGPWDHAGTRNPRREMAGVDFGSAALTDIPDLHRAWFDRWLKGEPDAAAMPRARLFVTGANAWRDADGWPPKGTRPVDLFLDSGGRANTLMGNGRLGEAPAAGAAADRYVYDPEDPVPSVVDANFYSAGAAETPLDHRFQHRRDDVLVYTTEPYTSPLTIAGHPEATLFARTDGPDTDWFVSLHDVSPTGSSTVLCSGRLRGRFRQSLERETLLEAGRTYPFTVTMAAVCHAIRAGHRLRLTVTSSDFPTWDRNPNTGHPIGQDTELRVATNEVVHDRDHPSRLRLPVAGEGVLGFVDA